jgi:hypothetical protein
VVAHCAVLGSASLNYPLMAYDADNRTAPVLGAKARYIVMATQVSRIIDPPGPGDQAYLPTDAMGPFLPVVSGDIDAFNSFLGDEIESRFSSSIRCCDGCFDAFQASWPGTAFRNFDFQKGLIRVELVVTQSRIPQVYTPAEVATLCHFVLCPRCGEYVRNAIWVHEDPAAEKYELDIERVAALARSTPFLVLSDPFAREIRELIGRLSTRMTTTALPQPLFRARDKASFFPPPMGLPAITEFGAPPAAVVKEGRFNHAGYPLLYLADSVATTLAEIGAPGEEFYVASLDITVQMRLLDLLAVDTGHDDDDELLAALAASTLAVAPRIGTGWVKKEYIFTRFLGDCARAAGFDAIRYGSTKHSTGCNYVVLHPPAAVSAIAKLMKVELIIA